jgi:hypothetical protein
MVLQNAVYRHEEEKFYKALGIDKRTQWLCQERIMFAHFANAMQVEDLFEGRDDAPKEMTTCTGDLQRCLQMIQDPLEYEYTLLVFQQFQKLANEIYGRYQFMQDENTSQEDKMKLKIMNMMAEMKLMEMHKEEPGMDDEEVESITPTNLMRRIPLVRRSQYSFDKYIGLVESRRSPKNSTDFDIDGLINSVLDDDED